MIMARLLPRAEQMRINTRVISSADFRHDYGQFRDRIELYFVILSFQNTQVFLYEYIATKCAKSIERKYS